MPLLEDGFDGDDGGADADDERDTATVASLNDDTASHSTASESYDEGSTISLSSIPAQSLRLSETSVEIRVRPMSRYQFKVRAWNRGGWSEWSPASEAMITMVSERVYCSPLFRFISFPLLLFCVVITKQPRSLVYVCVCVCVCVRACA